MKRSLEQQENILEILLILGTDLAGKDHFANVLTDAIVAAGGLVERRRGWFSAGPDTRRTSEGKGIFKLCLEWLFLATLPFTCRLIPFIAALLLRCDVWLFRPPEKRTIIVVSHTAIRLLAFALSYSFVRTEDIRLPIMAERTLRSLEPTIRVRTFVLDINHEVRAVRLKERLRRGKADHFDRFLGKNPTCSERIEKFLVWLCVTYLEADLVENNNMSNSELLACLPQDLRRRYGLNT